MSLAADDNMEEWRNIQGLPDKIRSTGMGGISADEPDAVGKLKAKLKRLEAFQDNCSESGLRTDCGAGPIQRTGAGRCTVAKAAAEKGPGAAEPRERVPCVTPSSATLLENGPDFIDQGVTAAGVNPWPRMPPAGGNLSPDTR